MHGKHTPSAIRLAMIQQHGIEANALGVKSEHGRFGQTSD